LKSKFFGCEILGEGLTKIWNRYFYAHMRQYTSHHSHGKF